MELQGSKIVPICTYGNYTQAFSEKAFPNSQIQPVGLFHCFTFPHRGHWWSLSSRIAPSLIFRYSWVVRCTCQNNQPGDTQIPVNRLGALAPFSHCSNNCSFWASWVICVCVRLSQFPQLNYLKFLSLHIMGPHQVLKKKKTLQKSLWAMTDCDFSKQTLFS